MMSFCLLRGRNVLSTQKSQGELTSSLIDLQRAESEIMIRVIMNVGGLRIRQEGIRSDTKLPIWKIQNRLCSHIFFFHQKMPWIKVLCITFPILL